MDKKIKIILNFSLIILALGIVLYISLKDNYDEIINYIFKIKLEYIILSILSLLLFRIIIGISSYLVTTSDGSKFKLIRSIQINFIMLFFQGITPFASGGQASEIYYLHKEKVSKVRATNIALQDFIIYQVALLVVEFVAIIYNKIFNLFPSNSIINKLVLLGMFFNFLILLISFILGFSKKVSKFILKIGIRILKKVKLISNSSLAKDKIQDLVNNFHDNALELIKNKKRFIICILLNILALLVLYSIPYYVMIGLNITNVNIINVIIITTYIMVISPFMPIPGGIGGLEYGFIYFFGYIITGNILTAVMLIWRFLSYYLGLIIGAVILMFYRRKNEL